MQPLFPPGISYSSKNESGVNAHTVSRPRQMPITNKCTVALFCNLFPFPLSLMFFLLFKLFSFSSTFLAPPALAGLALV